MNVYRCEPCRVTFKRTVPTCPLCGKPARRISEATPDPPRAGPAPDTVRVMRRRSSCCG